ncbi:RNA polymerase subunit sigma-24 [Ornithinimicrobium pekingense]|uniref:RNA polymerase subunit sigma-24 n=1 Tax=Ornithinimicrobium pekingense TaxID=384677 RepID=A0ABQ2F696_9MICO|nr:RNA polymerase subunit sigma-24 [Ornithinimicrobium pekingense]
MGAGLESSLEAAVRTQWSVIVAGLLRTTGDWDLAEDCAQDATERALLTWPRDGVPDNPAAWLTSVARRRALDLLRRRSTESRALQAWTAMTEATAPTFDFGGGYADDRLRLLFTCCHPDLALRDRVALTLRTLCGLSTRDVARLMLVSEPAMSQRLLRVRKQILRQGLVMSVPPADQVQDRVAAVLAVIYLLFTEGYSATEGTGVRDELAEEALALAQLATWLLPGHGEAHALRALILLQHARRPARTASDGTLVPLEEQDRTRWDSPLLAAGMESLRRARAAPDSTDGLVGIYRPQAEIAALHSTAPTPAETDWEGIVAWYDLLLDATASPVVAMNRAVAIGLRDGPVAGLAVLEEVVDQHRLDGAPEVPAIRADLLRRAGDRAAAHEAYQTAHDAARTEAVRGYLRRRAAELG